MRKGIILAGGAGSRLYPLTFSVTKQLLPIHDKPMIYYPLSTLMNLGVKDILIISTVNDEINFKNLLGSGNDLGINLSYLTQEKPNGIAEGLIIGEKFLSGDSCVFILGDNLFIGSFEQQIIQNELKRKYGATIFTYKVMDPERYGVVVLNDDHKPIKLIEKPQNFISNRAITGIYFYDNEVVNIAKSLQPSKRNELEITDLNKYYLNNKSLNVVSLEKNFSWLDAGTVASLYEASNIVSALEARTGEKIACLEEIAYKKKYIKLSSLKKIRHRYGKSEYGQYLDKVIEE